MRIKILAVIAALVLFSCNTKTTNVEKGNKIPKNVVEQWMKNLDNAPESIYENFDNTPFNIKHYQDTFEDDNHHLKFYMGKSGSEYRLFSLVCQGKLADGEYINLYETIYFFTGKEWVKSSKGELNMWLTEWIKDYPKNHKAPFCKAFIVPNEDIDELHKKSVKDKVYILFGMDKGNDVKLVLSNKTKTKGKLTEVVNDPIDPIFCDACTPCPDVCGSEELPD